MMSLDELADAYSRGGLTRAEPLILDNDTAFVYRGDEKVFEMHPGELLERLLTARGIPWEPA